MEDDGRQPEWQINRFVDIKISNILIRLPAIEWRKFCRVGTGVAYRNSYGKIIRFRGWQKKRSQDDADRAVAFKMIRSSDNALEAPVATSRESNIYLSTTYY